MTSILITEGDERLRWGVRYLLGQLDAEVIEIAEKARAFRYFNCRKPDLVILGSCRENDRDDLRTVEYIRKRDNDIPIILITRHSSEARAIRAFRSGIADYFTAPLEADEFVKRIRHTLLGAPTEGSVIFPDFNPRSAIIGNSPPMREIKTYLSKVAATDSAVLITGKTGTSKELAASSIHLQSPRKRERFICVNCASIPDTLVESELFGYSKGAFTGAVSTHPGKFEAANGGSVFLGEIGDMSPYTQAKILRSIETKEVHPLGARSAIPLDVRFIAASQSGPRKPYCRRQVQGGSLLPPQCGLCSSTPLSVPPGGHPGFDCPHHPETE